MKGTKRERITFYISIPRNLGTKSLLGWRPSLLGWRPSLLGPRNLGTKSIMRVTMSAIRNKKLLGTSASLVTPVTFRMAGECVLATNRNGFQPPGSLTCLIATIATSFTYLVLTTTATY